MGIGYALRGIVGSPVLRIRLTDGMMGATPADMSLYMDMFHRHTEITRTVEEIPGGVRTTTQSDTPDLAAKLREHVSSMYSHLGQGSEVMCMSQSLPVLFRNAGGYRHQLTLTLTGVIADETSVDPALTDAIRAHAREVTVRARWNARHDARHDGRARRHDGRARRDDETRRTAITAGARGL
jgi:hypothetical protein